MRVPKNRSLGANLSTSKTWLPVDIFPFRKSYNIMFHYIHSILNQNLFHDQHTPESDIAAKHVVEGFLHFL